VHVGEPLLEAQNLFANDLEAEMAGLDDAGVHRADGYLVHTVAVDPHERIFLLAGLPFRRRSEIAPQRILVDRPARHPRPWALIIGVAGDAQEVERRALHPVRGREDRRDVGKMCVGVGQRVFEQRQSIAVRERDPHAETARPVALVARPQRHEASSLLPCEPARGEELSRAYRHALHRDDARQRGGGETERRDVHGDRRTRPSRSAAQPGDTSPRAPAGSKAQA
jgi:hypothetical protein